jgi:choline-glycine betaine transporter
LPFWSWVSVTLTTTLAVGILFWGTAEPLFHLYDTGISSIVPASDEALRFSMSSLYMHWSFTPYAIYTLPGLTFALVYYNLKLPFSLSAPISVLTRRQVPSTISQIVDGIALLALLLGLSASLGSGILSISGGISRLLPFEANGSFLGVVTFVIVFSFFISSASGLHKGIKLLADLKY